MGQISEEPAREREDPEITELLDAIFHYDKINECGEQFPEKYLGSYKVSLIEFTGEKWRTWNNIINLHDRSVTKNMEKARRVNQYISELENPSNSELFDRTSYEQWAESGITRTQLQHIKSILHGMIEEQKNAYETLLHESKNLHGILEKYKVAEISIKRSLDTYVRVKQELLECDKSEPDPQVKMAYDTKLGLLNDELPTFGEIVKELDKSYDDRGKAMDIFLDVHKKCITSLKEQMDALDPRGRSLSLAPSVASIYSVQSVQQLNPFSQDPQQIKRLSTPTEHLGSSSPGSLFRRNPSPSTNPLYAIPWPSIENPSTSKRSSVALRSRELSRSQPRVSSTQSSSSSSVRSICGSQSRRSRRRTKDSSDFLPTEAPKTTITTNKEETQNSRRLLRSTTESTSRSRVSSIVPTEPETMKTKKQPKNKETAGSRKSLLWWKRKSSVGDASSQKVVSTNKSATRSEKVSSHSGISNLLKTFCRDTLSLDWNVCKDA